MEPGGVSGHSDKEKELLRAHLKNALQTIKTLKSAVNTEGRALPYQGTSYTPTQTEMQSTVDYGSYGQGNDFYGTGTGYVPMAKGPRYVEASPEAGPSSFSPVQDYESFPKTQRAAVPDGARRNFVDVSGRNQDQDAFLQAQDIDFREMNRGRHPAGQAKLESAMDDFMLPLSKQSLQAAFSSEDALIRNTKQGAMDAITDTRRPLSLDEVRRLAQAPQQYAEPMPQQPSVGSLQQDYGNNTIGTMTSMTGFQRAVPSVALEASRRQALTRDVPTNVASDAFNGTHETLPVAPFPHPQPYTQDLPTQGIDYSRRVVPAARPPSSLEPAMALPPVRNELSALLASDKPVSRKELLKEFTAALESHQARGDALVTASRVPARAIESGRDPAAPNYQYSAGDLPSMRDTLAPCLR